MWKLIIEDLEYATGVLDWQPLNGQYGRITKGMCLAYLAEAYMYNNDYDSAKQRLKQIIDSKTYELLPCLLQFTIWEIIGRKKVFGNIPSINSLQ